LPGTVRSLVLIMSRRRLAALEDATQISLDTLSPDDAGILLAGLAPRPSLGSEDPALGEITRLCGYLPLVIGMLASQLSNHPARTTADLASELRRLAVDTQLKDWTISNPLSKSRQPPRSISGSPPALP
jgi:hypothetical protein